MNNIHIFNDIKLDLFFKLSYLSSNFALTLGYVNPASNNLDQINTLHMYLLVAYWISEALGLWVLETFFSRCSSGL